MGLHLYLWITFSTLLFCHFFCPCFFCPYISVLTSLTYLRAFIFSEKHLSKYHIIHNSRTIWDVLQIGTRTSNHQKLMYFYVHSFSFLTLFHSPFIHLHHPLPSPM